jgi:hypothetical protein
MNASLTIDFLTGCVFFSIETLKRQAKQQADEYDRLATQFNQLTGANSNKRVD